MTALPEMVDLGTTVRESLPIIEVGGFPVRCIASNIRTQKNIDWREYRPVAGVGVEGNLVLGQVESVGARREMEYLTDTGIADLPLNPGDYIVGVLANRHSGTSEYGEIPPEGIITGSGGNVDLLASGGVIGKCLGVPKSLGDTPTKLKAIALFEHTPDGKIAELRDLFPPRENFLMPSAPIILSLGTAAEIGKTTTSAKLIEGLKKAGMKQIAASKLAGTGRKRDIAVLEHAGAYPALDFPDVGLATTYTTAERYTSAIYTLLNSINIVGHPNIIIAECGGDIIEGNIPTLLQDSHIMTNVVAIIHGSTDVLSLMGSLAVYEKRGILGKITIYLTYPIKRNYFAIHERLKEQGIKLRIFDPMNQEEMAQIIQQVMSMSRN